MASGANPFADLQPGKLSASLGPTALASKSETQHQSRMSHKVSLQNNVAYDPVDDE